MPINFDEIKRSALKDTAEKICVAARTAPKTRGKDNLVIVMLTPDEKNELISQMNKIAARDDRQSFARDAENIKQAGEIIIIATLKQALGLNCGYCGHTGCDSLTKAKGVCAYNSMDVGIALGSACALASSLNTDNRLMFSVGKAALELGILGKDVIQAIGIPLSATGKNPFFDRK